MHRDIILAAFAKAKKEEFEEYGIDASTKKASERLSAYISDHSDIPFSSRSLRNAHNDATKGSKTVKIIQPEVLNALCNYLGYSDYPDYVRGQKGKQTTTYDSAEDVKRRPAVKGYLWLVLVSILVLVGASVFHFSNRQRWMVWEENHYEEVPFNAVMLQEGKLKLLKKDRMMHFEKVLLTCDSVFFNPDGSPRYWYGKNSEKELEYFTALAQHPETGKSLKPITQYMIDKYICALKK